MSYKDVTRSLYDFEDIHCCDNPIECFGGHGERETPSSIPNLVVKPFSADCTAGGTLWETRTLPDFIKHPPRVFSWGVLFCVPTRVLLWGWVLFLCPHTHGSPCGGGCIFLCSRPGCWRETRVSWGVGVVGTGVSRRGCVLLAGSYLRSPTQPSKPHVHGCRTRCEALTRSVVEVLAAAWNSGLS